MKNRLFLIGMIIVLVVGISYSETGNRNTDATNDLSELKRQLEQTPRPDKEAELAALWLSDEIVAPESLYQQIRDGLSIIRSEYSDWDAHKIDPYGKFDPYGMHFRYRVEESRIKIGFTDSIVAQIRRGSYTEWDSLNALYRVTEIDTSWFGKINPNTGSVHLKFKGRLNPDSLVHYYSRLDGINWIQIIPVPGDFSNVFPWFVNHKLAFLFRDAWGDCPAGCMYSRFWYFKTEYTAFKFIGNFTASYDSIAPQWWQEIKHAYCKFRGHSSETCHMWE